MTKANEAWRVLVMDRDRATCEALGKVIGRAADFQVVGMATSVQEAREAIQAGEVDFLVVSSHLPSDSVLEVARWLRERDFGDRAKLLVTGLPEDEAVILKYLEAGASGFTLGEFTVEGLRLALRLIGRGEFLVSMRLAHLLIMRLSELAELVRDRGLDPTNISDLTPRETDVLELLGEELTNKEIAKRLYVSEGTVKSHVHQILRKLRVRGREEAVRVLRLHRASDAGPG